MPQNNNQRIRPTVYSDTTYYSSEDSNKMLRLDIWNSKLKLNFTNKISSDNVKTMDAYFSGLNLMTFCNTLKKVLALRQNEFISNKTHTSSFEIPFNLTKYDSQSGKTINNGVLKLVSTDKVSLVLERNNESIQVVLFTDRVGKDLFNDKTDLKIISELDLHDTSFINFVMEVEQKTTLLLPLYTMLTTMFEFYVGAKYKNGTNNGSSEMSYSNRTPDSIIDDSFTDIDGF